MEKKIRSHISLPLNLIKEFESNKKVCVFDLVRGKSYCANGTKVGVEKGYYSKNCELFLSTEIEGPFHNLINALNSFNYFHEKTNYLNNNHEILEKFFKYQYLRSKKILEYTNSHSVSAQTIEPVNHETFIAIMARTNVNILSLIEGNLFARIVTNNSSHRLFINNSLGFYTVVKKEKVVAFIVPISPKEAIYISSFDGEKTSHFTAKDEQVELMNKLCYISEKQIGNGFLISKRIEDFESIEKYAFKSETETVLSKKP